MERKKLKKNQSSKTSRFVFYIGIGMLLWVAVSLYSMTKGAADIPLSMIKEVLLEFDPENSKHLLIRDMRIPRVIIAGTVGSALAVAGGLMQGLTKNPMADAGLMGLNSGAMFVIALSYGILSDVSYTQMVVMAFFGATLSAVSVYGISYLVPGGNQPMKLVLAGATITSLLSALSQGIALTMNVSQNISFWTMGSVAGSQWKHVELGVPLTVLAILGAIMLSGQVTLISMGDEMAKGLGVRLNAVRFMGTMLVVILAGVSVSMAGMVVFVGIIIPHFAKYLIGSNYRYIIPLSAVYGGLLLVIADLVAKTINPPAEVPIGALISLIGVPVFLYIARRKGGR